MGDVALCSERNEDLLYKLFGKNAELLIDHADVYKRQILYELSWLWETLGIALVAAAVCVACAALICKAAKKKLSKKLLAVIGAAAFVGAILAVILIARTPMPL